MKKIIIAIIMGMFMSPSLKAGEHATALSQCLINNTTQADKNIMTQWVFSSLSNHPPVSSMSTITSEAKSNADQRMAKLVEKFMYDKCLNQVKTAVQNEGPGAIEMSIRSYVEIAGREVLNHPSVAGSVTGLASHMDVKRLFEALMTK